MLSSNQGGHLCCANGAMRSRRLGFGQCLQQGRLLKSLKKALPERAFVASTMPMMAVVSQPPWHASSAVPDLGLPFWVEGVVRAAVRHQDDFGARVLVSNSPRPLRKAVTLKLRSRSPVAGGDIDADDLSPLRDPDRRRSNRSSAEPSLQLGGTLKHVQPKWAKIEWMAGTG